MWCMVFRILSICTRMSFLVRDTSSSKALREASAASSSSPSRSQLVTNFATSPSLLSSSCPLSRSSVSRSPSCTSNSPVRRLRSYDRCTIFFSSSSHFCTCVRSVSSACSCLLMASPASTRAPRCISISTKRARFRADRSASCPSRVVMRTNAWARRSSPAKCAPSTASCSSSAPTPRSSPSLSPSLSGSRSDIIFSDSLSSCSCCTRISNFLSPGMKRTISRVCSSAITPNSRWPEMAIFRSSWTFFTSVPSPTRLRQRTSLGAFVMRKRRMRMLRLTDTALSLMVSPAPWSENPICLDCSSLARS
mmetsp:Transcript_24044/g.53450  ORF Transcript_24044/g.53450 Transcript_24044/m.53450 type:complete len:307 (+) Transcript_24044:1118-2038(+)